MLRDNAHAAPAMWTSVDAVRSWAFVLSASIILCGELGVNIFLAPIIVSFHMAALMGLHVRPACL